MLNKWEVTSEGIWKQSEQLAEWCLYPQVGSDLFLYSQEELTFHCLRTLFSHDVNSRDTRADQHKLYFSFLNEYQS